MKVRALVLVLLVLGACRRVDYTQPAPPMPPPERFVEAAAERAVGEAWLADFDDPALVALVREAWAANPDLIAAAARLEQAEARAAQAGAGRLPSVDLEASAARTRTAVRLPDGTLVPFHGNEYRLGLGASWEADVWGRLAAAQRAELSAAVAAASDLEGATVSLAARVARAYYSVTQDRLQLELAAAFLDSSRTTLSLLTRRFTDGRSPAVDVRAARSQVALAETDVLSRRQALAASRRELELLLGRYPAAAIEAAADLPSLPAPVAAGLPAELLLRRPDLQALVARLRAADERVATAQAELLPRLALTADGGYRSTELRELVRPESLVWSLVANLLQPLFDGGRRRAVVAEREARVRELAADYARAALAAFREVEQALAESELLREEIAAQGRVVVEGEAVVGELERRYRDGLVDGVVLLAERRDLLRQRQRLLALRLEALVNRIDLHLALGGSALAELPVANFSGAEGEP